MTQSNSKIQPLEVKETLKELKNKATKFISIIDDEKNLIAFQAKGEYSSFFFKVTGYKLIPGIVEGTRMVYDFTCFPYPNSELLPVENRQEAQGVFLDFNIWLDLVSDHINMDNNQDFDLLHSQNATNSPMTKETKQNTIQRLIDIALKYWWYIVIPIIIGVVVLCIEYKSGFFIQPTPH